MIRKRSLISWHILYWDGQTHHEAKIVAAVRSRYIVRWTADGYHELLTLDDMLGMSVQFFPSRRRLRKWTAAAETAS